MKEIDLRIGIVVAALLAALTTSRASCRAAINE